MGQSSESDCWIESIAAETDADEGVGGADVISRVEWHGGQVKE